MKAIWAVCKKISSALRPWRVARRYLQIISAIREVRPRTILEVGTWNGRRALEMATVALECGGDVRYYGFDLFELMTPDISAREFNVKSVPSECEVVRSLEALRARNGGFSYKLYKGFTRDTLPRFLKEVGEHTIDFVWLDGGHSVETIRSDWDACRRAVRNGGLILLDDFYTGVSSLTLEKFGCNNLVDDLLRDPSLKVRVLPVRDPVRGGGYTQIIEVRIEKG